MTDPSLATRIIGVTVILVALVVLLGTVLLLWRGRRKQTPHDGELEELLHHLAADFAELAANSPPKPNWFLEPDRRSREIRLASVHAAIAEEPLNAFVIDCRIRYLECWRLTSMATPESERHLTEVAWAGRKAALEGIASLTSSDA